MARRDSHERKVRGSQIRDSRTEKNRQERHETPSAGDQTPNRSTGIRDVSGVLDSFVESPETEAVTRRVERWLSVNRPVHVVGPTGCGKTALAMRVATERDRPVVWINGDADLDTSDLVGDYDEQEHVSVRDNYIHNVRKSTDIVRDRWVDNPLTVAVREGATLVYNEFSRTKPAANNALLSVFEEGILELPGQRGDDRLVEAHPEFRAILTSNGTEYAGVHEPQDALLDRLVGVYMDYYSFETEVEIVGSHVPTAPDPLARQCVDLVRTVREEFDWTLGTRAAIIAAEGLTTVPAAQRDDSLVVEVMTDVVASKVSDRGELAAASECVADALDADGGDGQ
ncbi:MAG: gas vesicle protein GvpN [Haloarculaceae archaeon]|jgi:gas vesicle protein GvpN